MSLHIVTDNYFYWCGMHDIADTIYLINKNEPDINNNIINDIDSMVLGSDDVFIVNLNQQQLLVDILNVIKKIVVREFIVESDFYLSNEMLMVSNVVFLARKYKREELTSIISDLWNKPVWRCS